MSDRLRKRDGWRCAPVAHAQAKACVERWHYAKGMSNTAVLCMGLHAPDGTLVGVAAWLPPAPGVVRWAKQRHGGDKVISLSRMAIAPGVPKNAASFLLAACVKHLRREGWDVAVTYADTLEGHTGHVYLAAGWTRDGQAAARARWVDPQGRVRSAKATKNLTVAQMRAKGWRKVPGAVKPRFVKDLR